MKHAYTHVCLRNHSGLSDSIDETRVLTAKHDDHTGDEAGDDECSVYVFPEASALKPSMLSSAEFGGSAFWTLHQDFARYVWNCLSVGDALWARDTSIRGSLDADKESDAA